MSRSLAPPASVRRPTTALLLMFGLVLSLAIAGPARSAPTVNHDRVVSAVPGQTPAVNNGEVDAITQVGNVVVVGGTFTQVTPVGQGATTRNYLMAFDVGTGRLVPGFNPTLNNTVNEVVPGPLPDTVYVGGFFTTVNGATASHVTLLSTTTGQVVNNFRAASTNGVVNTMVQRGNRLFVGGNFTTAGGAAHGGLMSLNATTGALDPYVNNQVAQRHNDSGSGAQGAVGVRDLDVTPDASRLVAIGNFKRVDGLSRDQVVVLTLGPSSSVTPDWQTNRYSPYCFRFAFDTYMRGVSLSPDGSYFVIASTGGQNAGTLCDAAARFETRAVGNDLQPTWVNYSGGDTLWGVTVTEKAVYVGGHQRWMNNGLASDRAGPGAVPRPGISALNTTTGVPLRWNPGRNPRGAAVYALFATPTGLWMGSDTEYIGPRFNYRRPRLAFFPLASGAPEASDATSGLPGTAYLGGTRSTGTDDLRTSAVTTGGAAAAQTVASGGVDWSSVRGSFLAGDRLWYGLENNTFNSRTFTGSTFGTEVRIDPYNDPAWAGVDTGSGNTYDGRANDLYGQMSSVTGMAYAGGKLYYTRTNDSNLYWRWFNTDSGIIGSQLFTANGGRSWNGTLGMFAAAGRLYFVTGEGNLNQIALTGSGPTGASSFVNGPGAGGNDWRVRALFLSGASEPPPNTPPSASFTDSCSALACHFDATASRDTDGQIVSYGWRFGDTTTGSGDVVDHTFAAAGTYPIELTVTDNSGASTVQSRSITVSAQQTGQIAFRGASTRSANVAAPSVAVPSQTQEGDTLVLTATMSNATSASAPAGWTVVGDQSATSTVRSMVWVRRAGGGEAGTLVPVTMDTIHKATLVMTAYDGVSSGTPVTATASTDAGTTSHTTPAVTAPPGAWVLSVWGEKSAETTAYSMPVGATLRGEAYSTGSGRTSTAVADSNGPRSGSVDGLTATTNATSTRGINWSVVLPPE